VIWHKIKPSSLGNLIKVGQAWAYFSSVHICKYLKGNYFWRAGEPLSKWLLLTVRTLFPANFDSRTTHMDPHTYVFNHITLYPYSGAAGRSRNCRFIGKLVKAIPRQWCVPRSFFLWWKRAVTLGPLWVPLAPLSPLEPPWTATTICLNERKSAMETPVAG